MKFRLLDGREDGEHNGVGLVEMCNKFLMQGDYVFGAEAVVKVYKLSFSHLPRYRCAYYHVQLM